jgi:hypothetical protein
MRHHGIQCKKKEKKKEKLKTKKIFTVNSLAIAIQNELFQ